MKPLLACLSLIVVLASCSKSQKRVLIVSQGASLVDSDKRQITAAGSGHEEKEVMLYDEGKIDYEITSQAGTAKVSFDGDGIFILNLKKDTIVGSASAYTNPKDSVTQVGREKLMANIDSLQQILDGKVSAEKKTFYILPNHAVKITGNMDAQVVMPYHQMTSISVKEGTTPEVYRFYLISETRATLEKLKGFLGEGNQPVNDPVKK